MFWVLLICALSWSTFSCSLLWIATDELFCFINRSQMQGASVVCVSVTVLVWRRSKRSTASFSRRWLQCRRMRAIMQPHCSLAYSHRVSQPCWLQPLLAEITMFCYCRWTERKESGGNVVCGCLFRILLESSVDKKHTWWIVIKQIICLCVGLSFCFACPPTQLNRSLWCGHNYCWAQFFIFVKVLQVSTLNWATSSPNWI